MKRIISVSRRTDLPAFYSDWFRRRLEDGYVNIENPFNHIKETISLLPNDVQGFVFWSRYPKPLLKHFDYIDQKFGHNHYLHLTLNNYPKVLELNNPPIELVIRCVEELNQRYGSRYILWRYDPIIISNLTPIYWILENFEYLCHRLENKVEICITSFVDIYKKVRRNFEKLKINMDFELESPSFSTQVEIIEQMKEISVKYGIKLRLCCEGLLADLVTLPKSSCVNPYYFIGLFSRQNLKLKVTPTRKDCVCFESKDIGFYDSCLSGCQYCYAVSNHKSRLKRYFLSKRNKNLQNFSIDIF